MGDQWESERDKHQHDHHPEQRLVDTVDPWCRAKLSHLAGCNRLPDAPESEKQCQDRNTDEQGSIGLKQSQVALWVFDGCEGLLSAITVAECYWPKAAHPLGCTNPPN